MQKVRKKSKKSLGTSLDGLCQQGFHLFFLNVVPTFALEPVYLGDVVGLLDITKCLYEALEKLEKAHQSSKKLADALEGMQSEWAQPANQGLQNYVELVSLGCNWT